VQASAHGGAAVIIDCHNGLFLLERSQAVLKHDGETCMSTIVQELIAALADECDAAQIPSDYGGTAAVPLYDSKIEKEMREYVQKLS